MLNANSEIVTQQASEELELTDADLNGVVGGLVTVVTGDILSGNNVPIVVSDVANDNQINGIGANVDETLNGIAVLNNLTGFLGIL